MPSQTFLRKSISFLCSVSNLYSGFIFSFVSFYIVLHYFYLFSFSPVSVMLVSISFIFCIYPLYNHAHFFLLLFYVFFKLLYYFPLCLFLCFQWSFHLSCVYSSFLFLFLNSIYYFVIQTLQYNLTRIYI